MSISLVLESFFCSFSILRFSSFLLAKCRRTCQKPMAKSPMAKNPIKSTATIMFPAVHVNGAELPSTLVVVDDVDVVVDVAAELVDDVGLVS